jgi:hypothetical protein
MSEQNSSHAEKALSRDIKTRNHVAQGMKAVHHMLRKRLNTPEDRYKVAIAAPFTDGLTSVRQPGYSNVKTIALDKE